MWRVVREESKMCVHADSISLGKLSVLICNLGENPIKGGQARIKPSEAVQSRGEMKCGMTRQ